MSHRDCVFVTSIHTEICFSLICYTQNRDAHIFVADMEPSLAVHVLCVAFEKEMFGADFLWILPGYHQAQWWTEPAMADVNCTREELEMVLQHHLSVEFAPQRPNVHDVVVSNHTVEEILKDVDGKFMPSADFVHL